MRRVIRRPQLLAVLLVALVATGLHLSRFELCVGLDGHVALEPAGASCCGPARGEAFLGADAGCAAGCVDTPLELSLACAGARQVAPPPVVVAMGVPPERTGARSRLGARLAIGAPPSAPPRARRTTVLLC